MAEDGVVLGTLMSSGGPTYEWGKEVCPGYVGHYLGGQECDSIHNGSLSYTLLTIPKDLLLRETAQREMDLPADFWTCPGFAETPAENAHRLQDYLHAVRKYTERSSIGGSAAARDAVIDETIELFLQAIAAIDEPGQLRNSIVGRHYQTVRKAEDYLRSSSGRPVRLSELVQNTGVSQMGLGRAFQHVLDTSPITYLRCWRLSQVRRCLKEEAETGITITEAATRFGFWELGRFSGQYRQLFGELPSSTLRDNSGLVVTEP